MISKGPLLDGLSGRLSEQFWWSMLSLDTLPILYSYFVVLHLIDNMKINKVTCHRQNGVMVNIIE